MSLLSGTNFGFYNPNPYEGSQQYGNAAALTTLQRLQQQQAAQPQPQLQLQGGVTPQQISPVSGGVGQGDYLTQLYNKMLNMGPGLATTTSNTSTTTQGNASPQLEQMSQDFLNKINELSGGMQAAYQGKANTYGDLERSLANLYNTQASGTAGAAQSSALASGLTPLEAAGAANTTLSQALQSYFPQLAGLKTEAAGVPIELQNSLAGLQQNLALPYISNVLSPYYQSLSGTTQKGTTTTTSPMDQFKTLADVAVAIQSGQLARQQLEQQANQFAQSIGLDYQKMAQQGGQFQQTLAKELTDLQSIMTTRKATVSQGQQQIDNTLLKYASDYLNTNKQLSNQDRQWTLAWLTELMRWQNPYGTMGRLPSVLQDIDKSRGGGSTSGSSSGQYVPGYNREEVRS